MDRRVPPAFDGDDPAPKGPLADRLNFAPFAQVEPIAPIPNGYRTAFTNEDGTNVFYPPLDEKALNNHSTACKYGCRLFRTRRPGEHRHRITDENGRELSLCPI